MNLDSLTKEEKLSLALCDLYTSYGYTRYKMNKFEEYALYNDNKNFLGTNNVITFMASDGKLLALRPDVTLSIVKNTKATMLNSEKVFYTEKVYRYKKETKSFKEISQVGVEFLGNLDNVSVAEVIDLALCSLGRIANDFVLDISSTSFILAMFNAYGIVESQNKLLTKLLCEKNVHEVEKLNLSKEFVAAFKQLVTIGDEAPTALMAMEKLIVNDEMQQAYSELKSIVEALNGSEYFDNLRIDFSVESDLNYYTDIVFSGYIKGTPQSILKGGRYDGLALKMKKKIGALGFAVYVGDVANAHHTPLKSVNVLLTGGEDTVKVFKLANELRAKGEVVRIARNLPQGINLGKIYEIKGDKLEVKND